MIIQNGNVVFKDTVEKKDIRIADGKIEKIAETIAPEKGEAVIDAAGLHVFPGLIDMHVKGASRRFAACPTRSPSRTIRW